METLLEILEVFNDWWVLLWFIAGIVFIILGILAAEQNENVKALACVAMSCACHARCEVKILLRKMMQ